MECNCKYYLRDKEGKLVCSVCGKEAHGQPQIEDKMVERHEAPLYVSDKDKVQIWPPESPRISRVVRKIKKRR